MVIANFVMEIGLDNRLPTYSGGLGILAGDFALSLADLGEPAVFVTLFCKRGYTSQKLDKAAGQLDSDAAFNPESSQLLRPLEKYADFEIAGKLQKVRAWEYRAKGKGEVPILFLDTDVEENDPAVRQITARLYDGDPWHRLEQEMVLGIGGYRMLKVQGYNVDVYHLNESHAALLIVELLREYGDVKEVKRRCVFTTHTPVPAAQDSFPLDMIRQIFEHYNGIEWEGETTEGRVHFARLASKYSVVTNAVSLKHRYLSERVLGYNEPTQIEFVTNGVYHKRWVHDELKKLYSKQLPGWEETPSLLSGAFNLPSEELTRAHLTAKSDLVQTISERTAQQLAEDFLTIGIAKRVTSYKRNNLILTNLNRLIEIAERHGPIQLVFSGKAHPRDDAGKGIIRDILLKSEQINQRTDSVKIVYLENYDMDLAKSLVAGCDLWLNNPRRPLEACGTSGMKAAMNGVLNFSVYDGWWLEGGMEGVNGWGIGRRAAWSDLEEGSDSEDLEDMYTKLSQRILPTYYKDKERWCEMSKSSIATGGSLFNSYRMVEDYIARVYARTGIMHMK
jgi:starch phosphorylase